MSVRSGMSQTPRGAAPTFNQNYTRMRQNSVGGDVNIQKSFGAQKIKKPDSIKPKNNS